jgi:hypothetical protein
MWYRVSSLVRQELQLSYLEMICVEGFRWLVQLALMYDGH